MSNSNDKWGQIVFATYNKGKLAEMKDLFTPLGSEVLGLASFKGLPEIVEDGLTFAHNALIKAKLIAEHLQLPVLADDSGLCVDLLDGRPGIHSARYAGPEADDEANNLKLISELKRMRSGQRQAGISKSGDGVASHSETDYLGKAQFKCALVLYNPQNGRIIQATGELQGYITAHPQGTQGFGYDPLFVVPQFNKTMAELAPDVKNKISHRALALRQLFLTLGLTPSQ